MPHRLDTDKAVFIYENEFYPLSNFSAFKLHWRHEHFMTSEHAYHHERFMGMSPTRMRIQHLIRIAPSAHEAYETAQRFKKPWQIPEWEETVDTSEDPRKKFKVERMKEILLEKYEQHEYVRKKLHEIGDRNIVEDSWRDDFWGIGPTGNGLNMLGRLWKEIQKEKS